MAVKKCSNPSVNEDFKERKSSIYLTFILKSRTGLALQRFNI